MNNIYDCSVALDKYASMLNYSQSNACCQNIDYEIASTDEGVEVEVIIPGVKKEDISVKFQKDSFVIRYINRDGSQCSVEISEDMIIQVAEADIDLSKEIGITLALGILTIKFPYYEEQTKEIEIKEG